MGRPKSPIPLAQRRREAQKKWRQKQSKGVRNNADRTTPIALRIRSAVVHQITQMFHKAVATGTYNWKTPNDAYLYILIRGLKDMAKDDPHVREYLPRLEQEEQQAHMRNERLTAQTAMANTRTEVDELLGAGFEEAASQYVHVAYSLAEAMDPTVWRDWLLRELRTTYPLLLAQRPKSVTLAPKPAKARHATEKKRRRA